MSQYLELIWDKMEEDPKQKETIQTVVEACFQEEQLEDKKLVLSITLTIPEEIRKLNKQYRNIDQETDVLSFPMFEKQELEERKNPVVEEVLGDIIISIPRGEQQAKEYGHSVERELAYMVVHGFYHLMGYDHMQEEDKKQMRAKEEAILGKLKIER